MKKPTMPRKGKKKAGSLNKAYLTDLLETAVEVGNELEVDEPDLLMPEGPDWATQPVDDADRPFLEQFEELVMAAPDEEEYARGLSWLKENVYQNRDGFSVLHQRRPIVKK